jgi:hypothetical protein
MPGPIEELVTVSALGVLSTERSWIPRHATARRLNPTEPLTARLPSRRTNYRRTQGFPRRLTGRIQWRLTGVRRRRRSHHRPRPQARLV